MRKNNNIFWKKKKILVTGGASFIGSHLVDALIVKGASVRVVDNLSSGSRENIKEHLKNKSIEFIKADLLNSEVAKKATSGIDIVFHLASDHGGRGYVDLHQASTSTNFILDGNVFFHSRKNKVEKIVFASSGCVYPRYLQNNLNEEVYLKEEMAKAPHDADNLYGWSKLMAEMTLKAYYTEWGIKTVSCRFFTVYGSRGRENHAVVAMIARAFIKQNPFIVWGDGSQIRNWTYVSDIVNGLILAAQKIDDGRSINLGTMERIKVIDAAKKILDYTHHPARIDFKTNMPVGPINRVADNSLAKSLLGWEPRVKFADGLTKTIDWYFATKDPKTIRSQLEYLLTER